MRFFVLGILFVLCLVIHEGAHAFAMYRKKIPIKEAGIGWPIPGVPHVEINFPSFLPETVFTINPLLLGAYVQPALAGEAMLKMLSYKDRALIYGAGVLGNIFFALILWIIITIIPPGLSLAKLGAYPIVAFTIALIILLWKGKRIFCIYFVPVLGVLSAVLIIVSIAFSPSDAVAGPIGIGQMASELVTDIELAFRFGMVISLGIAIFNVLPLFPLDGGRVIDALLEGFGEKIQNLYRATGLVLFLGFIAFAFGGDILRFF